jgi:hypothetical protein
MVSSFLGEKNSARGVLGSSCEVNSARKCRTVYRDDPLARHEVTLHLWQLLEECSRTTAKLKKGAEAD